MEHAPFSAAGLEPEQLEKEKAFVLTSIENVQEAVHEIDFATIDAILLDILMRVDQESTRDGLKKEFSLEGRYPISVKYSGEVNTDHYGESFQDKGESAAYSVFPNIVVLAREFVDDKGTIDAAGKLYLLKVLIHEIMHHTSFGVEEREDSSLPLVHSGLSFGTPDESGYVEGNAFTFINEALTEMIADAVYAEYLARTGVVSEYEEKLAWYRQPNRIDRHAGYVSERLVLMSFVDRIAAHFKISEEKVYQALTVEYFTGGDLSRAEIVDEIKDIPEIKELIEKIKKNDASLFKDLSSEEQGKILTILDEKQLVPVKALLGRDYVGETNQARIKGRKFFNVLR